MMDRFCEAQVRNLLSLYEELATLRLVVHTLVERYILLIPRLFLYLYRYFPRHCRYLIYFLRKVRPKLLGIREDGVCRAE